MRDPKAYTLFSGGAKGAEAAFGDKAEEFGLQEVNFTFDGHDPQRTRGQRTLTQEELAKKDVSLTYVSRLLHRKFTNAPLMRRILQSIMYQIDSGVDIFVVGTIQADDTVKGGTGWGAEFAKICNKSLYVFDQSKDNWYKWANDCWEKQEAPVISSLHFTGTGTRFLEENGKKAIADLFARSFEK